MLHQLAMRLQDAHLMMTLLRNGLVARVVKKGLGSDRPFSVIRVGSVTKPSPQLTPASRRQQPHEDGTSSQSAQDLVLP